MVVSPLWRGPGNIYGFILDCSDTNDDRRFRCEDNNVTLRTRNLTTIACGRWSLVTI